MSAAELTLRGRAQAEALMVDTCTIKRPDVEVTTNLATGVVDPTSTTVYTGKCKLQVQRMQFAEMPDAGEKRHTVAPLEVHVPATTAGIKTGDRVEVTASFAAANVGRIFRVRTLDLKTFQTALRLIVEEVHA